MVSFRPFTVAMLLVAAAACDGCATLAPTVVKEGTTPAGRWADGLKRQYRRMAEEIRDDLSVLDSDDDGLAAFGPAAAREMRAMRAELGP